MERKDLLIERLNSIALSLEKTDGAIGLLGLGSIGKDLERLDNYSDLDFFVIVKKGMREIFIDNLNWLTCIKSASYYYRNSPDGYKLMFDDGIYCEFAVFEDDGLTDIPFSEGRVIWKTEKLTESICKPGKKHSPWKPDNLEWAFNEAISCVYVGLCRYARGEKLSGTRFIENFAVDILMAASYMYLKEYKTFDDDFQHERRIEIRYPDLSQYFSSMIQGYDKAPESALEVIKFIEKYYTVNLLIKEQILKLYGEIRSGEC